MSRSNTVRIAFPIKPDIRCPKCHITLTYVGQRVTHSDNGCSEAGRIFKLPVITLEEV